MGEDSLIGPIRLGIQFQGASFKLVLESSEKRLAEQAGTALYQGKDEGGRKLWFDFSLVSHSSKEYPTQQGRLFNQFSGTFLYRSVNLDRISPHFLIEMVVGYAHHIRAYEALILKKLDNICL
jgi:hypothetical protein